MNENARGGDIVSSEPTRPDVDAIRKRAAHVVSVSNWHGSLPDRDARNIVALCDYVDHLEAASGALTGREAE